MSEPPGGREVLAPTAHLMKPLREMISAWQSLTVSPFRLRESPFTQRLPGRHGRTWDTSKGQDDEEGGLLVLRASLYPIPTPLLPSLGDEHSPPTLHDLELNYRLFPS